jgi:predicted negative regulator of RcsB-dependent stress response
VDRLTRKELKTDKFALEVGHTVDWATEHRQELMRYGTIAAALVVAALAIYTFLQYRNGVREDALRTALNVQDAVVGGTANEGVQTFPTEQAKYEAVKKSLGDVTSKYPSSQQGIVAEYFLGASAADKGDLASAEKHFRIVADSSYGDYAALAKLALAPILQGEGKAAEGEKMLREVVDHPSTFVSKEEATIILARYLAQSKPAEARKLLEPLRGDRSAVSRAALTALADIGQK